MTETISILDVVDTDTFGRIPPCADGRFDHRSCDYWEDGVRGSKSSRPHWWKERGAAPPEPKPPPATDNPFASAAKKDPGFNPFAQGSPAAEDSELNPFAPPPSKRPEMASGPSKLRLLRRGESVFGSYAKILTIDGESAAFAQFGPLSAYPRAQRIRELYPRLPQSPLPAVITCIATTAAARGRALGSRLVEAVVDDLAERGFAAVEAYPDRTLARDEASSATPAFWVDCGFVIAADDDRYPVLRRELD